MSKPKNKRKGGSVQALLGAETFTRYGLQCHDGELLFFSVSPVNISVLSAPNVSTKIRHLLMVLSTFPNLEILCTDSTECFDDNRLYLRKRLEEEDNPKIRELLRADIDSLDTMQAELTSARQFVFCIHLDTKEKSAFDTANRLVKTVTEQGFECHRLSKSEIKQYLAVYFDASLRGDLLPDYDGEQYLEQTDAEPK